MDDEEAQSTIREIRKAVKLLSKNRIGALLVIERNMGLNDVSATGVQIDGLITSDFLINVFIPNTPLHDGAVVIAHNIVTAATCYLPLSEAEISKAYGTRHRAALGISESTDAVTVVVSEETGGISVTLQGRLIRIPDRETLRSYLPDNRKEKKGAQRPFLGLSFLRRREEKR